MLLFNVSVVIAVVVAVGVTLLAPLPLHEPIRSFLFERRPSAASQECVDRIQRYETISLAREVTMEELETFQRDGIVVLRQVLPPEWLEVLRALWMATLQNPSTWDILFTRLQGNFYGTQKSVFLHRGTSRCGQEVAQKAPTTKLAKMLLMGSPDKDDGDEAMRQQQQRTVRIIEPTLSLLSYSSSSVGHTSWHSDDVYMPFRPIDQAHGPMAAVRLWIPLAPLGPDQLLFLGLNNSLAAQADRASRGLMTGRANFTHFDQMKDDPVFQSHIIHPGNFQPGDVFAFAADTPHLAQSMDCSKGACPRMILSFVSDANAVYDGSKKSAVLPQHAGGQIDGSAFGGTQFPRVDPWHEEDWKENVRPTYADVGGSLVDGMMEGYQSFYGFSPLQAFGYVRRVATATMFNTWKSPTIDLKTGVVHW